MLTDQQKEGKRISLRMLECPVRRRSGCGLLDQALGWQHGMCMDECDQCWAKGSGNSPDGRAWLLAYGMHLLTRVKGRLPVYPLPFIQTVLGKHCSAEEKKQFLDVHGYALGVTGAVNLAKELGLDPAPYEAAAREVAKAWENKPSIIRTAIAWIKAKASSLGGTRRVDVALKQLRHASCFGTKDTLPCLFLQTGRDGYHYCGKCRCGRSKDARLDGEGYNKLDHPYLECPIGAAGFSNEGDPYPD